MFMHRQHGLNEKTDASIRSDCYGTDLATVIVQVLQRVLKLVLYLNHSGQIIPFSPPLSENVACRFRLRLVNSRMAST